MMNKLKVLDLFSGITGLTNASTNASIKYEQIYIQTTRSKKGVVGSLS